MKQEAPIRILDMGCGDGGNYIINQGENVSYVLVDRRLCPSLAMKYPDALCVVANIQYLPFPDGAFDKLETRFPHQTLLWPGLESVTGVGKLSQQKREPTWYPEFARVLKESGTLTIWSDVPWINVEQVFNDSASYFEVVNIDERVSNGELEKMGSFGCEMVLQKGTTVKKIILKKKKNCTL